MPRFTRVAAALDIRIGIWVPDCLELVVNSLCSVCVAYSTRTLATQWEWMRVHNQIPGQPSSKSTMNARREEAQLTQAIQEKEDFKVGTLMLLISTCIIDVVPCRGFILSLLKPSVILMVRLQVA